MDPKVVTAIVVVIALLVIAAIIVAVRKRRSAALREQFGPEYDRVVHEHGDAARAEAALAEREKRVHQFPIHSLQPGEREVFAGEWADVQRRFVDDPSMAVIEADKLVTRVMTARGYPMGDFDQRAADLSVNYPTVVQNYRSARNIVLRQTGGQATTEDLRQAMVHYRSLFDELLEQQAASPTLRRAS